MDDEARRVELGMLPKGRDCWSASRTVPQEGLALTRCGDTRPHLYVWSPLELPWTAKVRSCPICLELGPPK